MRATLRWFRHGWQIGLLGLSLGVLAQTPPEHDPPPSRPLALETAQEIDLDGLAGLGPAMTRRILAERERQPFAHWDDLLRRVKGLGPHLAQRLSAQGLRVQGEPWPGRRSP